METTGEGSILKLVRENPEAAGRLLATMLAQTTAARGQIAREVEAAKQILAGLAAASFHRREVERAQRELRKRYDNISVLKRRLQLGLRKAQLLQQLAGSPSGARLDAEIERLVAQYRQLHGQRRKMHLLDSAQLLFSEADMPDHLHDVQRQQVAASAPDHLATEASQVSPRRVLAELIARNLDGSRPETRTRSHGLLPAWERLSGLLHDEMEEP
jgi:hypothetical protein